MIRGFLPLNPDKGFALDPFAPPNPPRGTARRSGRSRHLWCQLRWIASGCIALVNGRFLCSLAALSPLPLYPLTSMLVHGSTDADREHSKSKWKSKAGIEGCCHLLKCLSALPLKVVLSLTSGVLSSTPICCGTNYLCVRQMSHKTFGALSHHKAFHNTIGGKSSGKYFGCIEHHAIPAFAFIVIHLLQFL